MSLVAVRRMAAWMGPKKLASYQKNADVAEEMIVRAIRRLQDRNIKVVLFETPLDVEAITLLRGEEKTRALMDDFYARVDRIASSTDVPVLFIGSQTNFPTTVFSDWMHVIEEGAREIFTRTLASELVHWYRPLAAESSM
jgi:hypothetical protein